MNSSVKSLAGARVFVGLSGGVDSAVTAALLQRAGADITGVFIKGWYPPGLPCTWGADRRDAMRVAARLGIPFFTLDASVEYKKSVIDYLLREYEAGRTPNPDIMCNRDVKFGAFYDFALAQGADFIATGHYARIMHGSEEGPAVEQASSEKGAGIAGLVPEHFAGILPAKQVPRLLRGIDASKDQSYFLWAVPKEALAHTLFPLGSLEKKKVRELARTFDLPVAEKKDSQGICFLGPVSVEDFLKNEFGLEEGGAVDASGALVGRHAGALAYTLGERLSLADAPAGPWYVIGKNIAQNTVVVSHKPVPAVKSADAVLLSDSNIFSDASSPIMAQYRYHGPLIEGTFNAEAAAFSPAKPVEEMLAPGQSLVLYRGEELVGGGIIR